MNITSCYHAACGYILPLLCALAFAAVIAQVKADFNPADITVIQCLSTVIGRFSLHSQSGCGQCLHTRVIGAFTCLVDLLHTLNMDITLNGQQTAGGLLVGFTRLQMDISSQ